MSTRRARIKAVTALPPRRKNADKADDKKKQVELKEESESASKPEQGRPKSLDKQSCDKNSHAEIKVRLENDIKSPNSRRSSIDKTPKEHQDSIDQTVHDNGKEGSEEPSRTRRLSDEKSPKQRRSSANKTPNRRFSLEKYSRDLRLSVELTIEKELSETKSDSKKSSTENESVITPTKHNVSNEQTRTASSTPTIKSILQAHLEKSPKNAKSNNFEPSSIRKEDSTIVKDVGSKTANVDTYFASPKARASINLRRSSIVRTPVIEVDLTAEKWITPHKGPNSVTYYNDAASKCNDVNKKLDSDRGTDDELEVMVEKLTDKDVSKLDDTIAGGSKKKNDQIQIIDDFVIKPFPEKSTVMDGIVPLHTVSKAPKPLDLLKNEIISENAEVLFDPIVPLPSPSKVRPKLRPVPRLYPLRRNSVQGSASESEDETRRALHGAATPVHSRQRHDSHSQSAIKRDAARVRNDSVCSTVSQAPSQITAAGSPQREKIREKSRREEQQSRRVAAMRRRQAQVEREKLTMYDLIFYNPKDNPIIPDQDEINAKEATMKEEAERKEATKQECSNSEASEPAAAVPQIKLGPNGEIILDEQSLVINQSESRKLDASVVREGAWANSSRSRAYRRTARTADWSDAETVKFYRALAALGTDFTLMQPLFPTRNRRDLKLKFKKEERNNLAQVDKALRSGAQWDPERLETEFSEERKAAEENARKEKERLKREKEEERQRQQEMKQLRLKRSRSSKLLGDSAMPKTFSQGKLTPSTIDEYVTFQEERKRRLKPPRKKKRDDDFAKVTPINAVAVQSSGKLPSPSLATLTLVDRNKKIAPKKAIPKTDMAILSREVPLPIVPQNIEKGSLVVLTVNDPQSPSRKMLQTYIAQGPGELAPVSLPPMFLNSVVGFMKKGQSPTTTSPVVSRERSNTPQMSPRKRKSSYTITQL